MQLTRLLTGLFVTLAAVIVLGAGCDGDPAGPGGAIKPRNPVPPEGAEDVPTMMTEFAWSYKAATADSFFYDFYLGTSKPLPVVASRLTDTLYTLPGTMIADTTYFWKVVVYDSNNDSISSSTWRFTTENTVRFPILPGMSWQFTQKIYHAAFNPPEIRDSVQLPDTVFGSSTTLIADTSTVSDTIEAFRFHSEWYENSSSGTGEKHLNNTDSGFMMYAVSGTGVAPPKTNTSPKYYLEFKGRRFTDIDQLHRVFGTVQSAPTKAFRPGDIEDPPIREIAYPIEIDNEWIYRSTDRGHVWNMKKRFVDHGTISVPAGEFESYNARWFWDIDEDGQWDTDIDGYDYISLIGTVKRVFYFYDVQVVNYEFDTLGTVDIVHEFELTDFDIP